MKIKKKKQLMALQDLKDNKEEQTKTIEDKSDNKLLMQEKFLNRLLDEKMNEIQKISKEIDFNNLFIF